MKNTVIPNANIDQLTPLQLRVALTNIGAIRLEGAVELRDSLHLQDAAEEAFALPAETLERYRRHGIQGGYTPAGIEGVRDLPGDVHRDFWDLLPAETESHRLPEEAIRFACAMQRAFARCQAIADTLFTALDATRPAEQPRLAGLVGGGRSSLRATRYFATERERLVFPSHLDFGMLTLYVGGAGRGLQHLHDGNWHDLENPHGSVVAACGTTLRMYEPSFRPLRHRVLSAGTERRSVVFFTEPHGEVVLPNGSTAAAHLTRLVNRIRHE